MCIESMIPSSHLILCCPLRLLPLIPPGIKVFSNESALHMKWPEYWSFSLSISPSSEHPGLVSPLGWTGCISLQSKGLSRVFSSTTVQKHQFFGTQLSSQFSSHIHTWYIAAKSLQSCPTLCDPVDGSPPGSPVPGILQARTLEWFAISFSNA